jgi:hypothetical protein
MQFQKVIPLHLGQFWLLALQPPLGFCDRHTLAGARPDQIRLELATIPRTLNSSRPTGSVGSWVLPPRLRTTPLAGQLIGNIPGIGKGTRQTVQLGHHQSIAGSACRHRFTEPRAQAVSSCESMIDEDLSLLPPPPCTLIVPVLRTWLGPATARDVAAHMVGTMIDRLTGAALGGLPFRCIAPRWLLKVTSPSVDLRDLSAEGI